MGVSFVSLIPIAAAHQVSDPWVSLLFLSHSLAFATRQLALFLSSLTPAGNGVWHRVSAL